MLKRFLFLAAVVACIAFLMPNYSLAKIAHLFPSATYSFYTASAPDTLSGASVIKNGGGYIVSCPARLAEQISRSVLNQSGQSFTFSGNTQDIDGILKKFNATIIKREQVGADIISCYAYTNKLGDYITAFGSRVNLHLVMRGGTVTVGTPVILGSF